VSAVTRLALRPYAVGDSPGPGSVPVSVVVLTRNEEPNIRRCLASVAWADQVIVVDSGSTDETMSVAKALGATVVEQPWLGFSDQREASLRLPQLRHDWLYFVDADQWVSPQLASEIAAELKSPECSAFLHRFRLVFMGKWIRHCGWYRDSWNVQLLDRRYAKYDGGVVGERVYVDGLVGRLRNDIVDDDLKGVAAWLRKHVHYAELEADRRSKPAPLPERLRALRSRNNVRSLKRAVLKDIIYPSVPAKPVLLFLYMYIVQLGFLDGLAGLRFCYFHAWFEVTVQALQADRSDS
jgi:glycosyltransferase involved in cell wall biosynthesis